MDIKVSKKNAAVYHELKDCIQKVPCSATERASILLANVVPVPSRIRLLSWKRYAIFLPDFFTRCLWQREINDSPIHSPGLLQQFTPLSATLASKLYSSTTHPTPRLSTPSYSVPTCSWTQATNTFCTKDSYSPHTSFLIFSLRPRFSSSKSANWARRAVISTITLQPGFPSCHSRESQRAKLGVSEQPSLGASDPEL